MKQQNLQGKLYDLWFKHYTTATAAERVELVERFIEENLDGYDITVSKAKHPAHYHKEADIKIREYAIATILGDFIIRAEDDTSRLTTSPQVDASHENKRNINEASTDFTDLYDDEEGTEKPVGSLTEHNVYKARAELYEDITEPVEAETTVTEFKAMLETVKTNAEEYARIYSEKYRKDYRETLRRIRRLDVGRVAICEECGEVFYRHDMRRLYCDLQGDGKPTCEVNAKRRRESNRYSDNRSGKVKDKTETLHYRIEGQNITRLDEVLY